MICAENFTFIHLHKTGGQSINDALLHCIPGAQQIGYHLPIKYLPKDAVARPIIGVIRNPWDWYVSWYAFNNLRGVKNPLFNIVSRGKQAGFKETIGNLIQYPESGSFNDTMKACHRALLPERFEDDGGAGFTKGCVDAFHSETEGYLTLLAKRMYGPFSDNVSLLPFERLEDQLASTLKRFQVPQSDALERYLAAQPRKNSSSHGHYSQYYDDELIQRVAEKESEIIEQFGYAFTTPETAKRRVSIEPGVRVKKLGGSRDNFRKLGDIASLNSLRKAVQLLPEEAWALSDRQKQFDIHKETQSIQLLADDMSHTPPIKTKFFERFADEVNPILNQLLEQFGNNGIFIRVLLARLNAHSQIKPHVDKGYSLINCNRIHVPLITNDEVTFSVGGESRRLAEGEIWEINNAHVHSVMNASTSARVHLIVDWTPKATLLKEKKPFRMDLPMFYKNDARQERYEDQ